MYSTVFGIVFTPASGKHLKAAEIVNIVSDKIYIRTDDPYSKRERFGNLHTLTDNNYSIDIRADLYPLQNNEFDQSDYVYQQDFNSNEDYEAEVKEWCFCVMGHPNIKFAAVNGCQHMFYISKNSFKPPTNENVDDDDIKKLFEIKQHLINKGIYCKFGYRTNCCI